MTLTALALCLATSGGPNAIAADGFRPKTDVLWCDHGAELWARGATYKTGAAADGFSYVPFLGAEASRNWPVRFTLSSATVGTRAIALEAGAAPVRNGARITLDRGPVDVHYDHTSGGVEQSFTIEGAFGDGPLVLELDVETDLVARGDGAGFSFDGPEGGVRYGAAIAFDQAGHEVEVPATLDGDALRLTVPAGFVASARGTITVDPLISTWTVDGDPSQYHWRPDLAFDQGTDITIFAFEEPFSQTDVDILSRASQGNGNILGFAYVALDAVRSERPAVANLALEGITGVAFQRETATGSHEIYLRTLDVAAAAWSGDMLVSRPGDDATAPDIGGTGGPTAGRFAVAWVAESQSAGPDVVGWFRIVESSGTMGVYFFDASISNVTIDEVAVSHRSFDDGTVAFWPWVTRGVDRTTGEVSIFANGIRHIGFGATGGSGVLHGFGSTDVRSIDVSTPLAQTDLAGNPLDPTYIVSYTQENGPVDDVWLMICRNEQSFLRRELTPAEHGDGTASQDAARLATYNDGFVVSYLERPNGQIASDVRATSFDLVGGAAFAITERRILVGDLATPMAGACALTSRHAGGATGSSQVIAGWADFDINANASWDIQAGLLSLTSNDGAASQYCTGTVNSTGERAFITIYGDNSTTNTKIVHGEGIPPQQFCLLALGTLPASVNPVPNSEGTLCLGGQLGRYNAQIQQASASGTIQLTLDPTALPTPFGFEPAVSGMARGFQYWFRDVSSAGQATSNFTNAVLLPFQ